MAKYRVYEMRAAKLCGWSPRVRVVHPLTGGNIQRSQIDTIHAVVRSGNGDETYSAALTINSVLSDTLIQDDTWDEDSYGYNFYPEIPGSAFSTVGPVSVTFIFTPESGHGERFVIQYSGSVASAPNTPS